MEWGNKEQLEQLYSYLKSDENMKICQPFISECQRINDTIKNLNINCSAMYDELYTKVNKIEYSIGGKTMHRGFYCPSPIMDIIVVDCKRGKRLNQLRSNSNPNYKYMFDDVGNLILVDHIFLGYKEIIFYQDEKEIGIIFSDKDGIRSISECIYHGKQIQSYIYCLFFSYENYIYDYTKEEYLYSEMGLSDVNIYRFLSVKETPTLRHEKYRFQHDAEGYLTKYCIDTDKDFTKAWTDVWYDIKINRKV